MPDTTRSLAAAVAVGVLVLAGALVPIAGATGHPGTDNTVTRIEVHEDASATWVVQIRTRLATDESVDGYEAFQTAFRANRSAYVDPYRDRMTAIVASAANETGRPMAARNVTAETSIQAVPRRWGVVTYEFTWRGFAERDGRALVVGDVFENGLFIARNDTLQIVAPEGYAEGSVEPRPDETDAEILTWTGRRDFADGRPRVRFEPDGRSGGTLLPAVPGSMALASIAVGLVLVLALGLGYRALSGESTELAGDGAAVTGASAGPVTDEERVQQILAANGGRMKQSAIVGEVDWSKSKVSRVLTRLEEDGVVSRLRIGRENVVELDDE